MCVSLKDENFGIRHFSRKFFRHHQQEKKNERLKKKNVTKKKSREETKKVVSNRPNFLFAYRIII
jgi:hypothetical protein